MTSHPKDATHELFDTLPGVKKYPAIFICISSPGSNQVLKMMNRGYTREQYLELIEYARKAVPGIAFTSDVIVGFPGETREDFEQTLDLIKPSEFCFLIHFYLFAP